MRGMSGGMSEGKGLKGLGFRVKLTYPEPPRGLEGRSVEGVSPGLQEALDSRGNWGESKGGGPEPLGGRWCLMGRGISRGGVVRGRQGITGRGVRGGGVLMGEGGPPWDPGAS